MYVFSFIVMTSLYIQGSIIDYTVEYDMSFKTYQQCSTARLYEIQQRNTYIGKCKLKEN